MDLPTVLYMIHMMLLEKATQIRKISNNMHHNVPDNTVTKLDNYTTTFKSSFAWVHSIFFAEVYLATKWTHGQFSLTLLQSHLERSETVHSHRQGFKRGIQICKCFNLHVMSTTSISSLKNSWGASVP